MSAPHNTIQALRPGFKLGPASGTRSAASLVGAVSPALRFSLDLLASRAFRTDGAEIYRWTGSSWRRLSEYDAESFAVEWLEKCQPDRASAKYATECCATARLKLPKFPGTPADNLIPVRDAWLRIAEDGDITVMAPDPAQDVRYELGLTLSAPVGEFAVPELNPDTLFAKFLDTSLPNGEVRELVQEYVGYTLLPDCRFQTAQIWVGQGRNGKSVLSHVVRALHARPTALRLDRLEGFELEGIVGSSLVLCDETPKHGINQQALKTLISGGEVQINPKGRRPYSYRPTAKWIICTNHVPATKDHSDGWWRRLQLVEWDSQIPEGKVVRNLERKIVDDELHHVLFWALHGLQRLIRRGDFQIPECVARAKDDYQIEANSVRSWVSDCSVTESTTRMTAKTAVFEAYLTYCEENRLRPCGTAELFRRLYQQFPAARENAKRLRVGDAREWRVPLLVGVGPKGLPIPTTSAASEPSPWATDQPIT